MPIAFVNGGGRSAGLFVIPANPMAPISAMPGQPARYNISGITKDTAGAALGSCVVEVFETVSGLLRGSTVSDASGNYSLDVTGGMGLTFFCVGYKAGSPDVAGTTINSLVGV